MPFDGRRPCHRGRDPRRRHQSKCHQAVEPTTPPCRKRELSPKFRAPRHLRSSRRVSMWVDASVSRPTVCRECRYRETGRRMAGPVTTAGTKCGSRIITNMTRTRKREKEFAAQVAIGWRSRWWYATRSRHGPGRPAASWPVAPGSRRARTVLRGPDARTRRAWQAGRGPGVALIGVPRQLDRLRPGGARGPHRILEPRTPASDTLVLIQMSSLGETTWPWRTG